MADEHNVLLMSFTDPQDCREAFQNAKVVLPGLAYVGVLERSPDGMVDVPESHAEDTTKYTVGAGVAGGLLGLLAGPVGALLGLANAAAVTDAVERAREEEGWAGMIFLSSRVEEGTAMLVADLYEESHQPADDLARRHGGTLERLPAKEFAAQVRAAEKAARKA
ncbi:hypothetical protein ACFQVC_23045 [Streptomyces monticola]|uniref:DUF1269 domain-containing protein n=1 Tax=Streptomyces monticola TaxID=2666263 RepID=A0ABW2JMT7_9ACTN